MESTRTESERVGARLARLRTAAGFSQNGLAAATNHQVSPAYISRIEKGERAPSMKTLRLLAPHLGVSSHYLETGESGPLGIASELVVALEPWETQPDEVRELCVRLTVALAATA